MSRNDIVHGHKSYRGRRESVVKRGERRVRRTRGAGMRDRGDVSRDVRGKQRRAGFFFGPILWEQPRVARTIKRIISIEVRPFSTTIDTNARVARPRGWRRRARGGREGERGF